MKLLRKQSTPGAGEVISPWVGLSLGALYLAAVGGVWAAAVHVQRTQLKEQRLADTSRWVDTLVRQLAPEMKDAELAREIVRIGRGQGIAFSAIVSGSGTVVAHSDPALVGKQLPEVTWREGALPNVRIGEDPGTPGRTILGSQIRVPSGRPSPGELYVGLMPVRFAWRQSDLVLWSGYVLAAVMGLYLLVYRVFRRSVQPLAIIRRRLLGCDEAMADRLVALRLNDSFDQISASWNRLIEFAAEMQEQVRRSKLSTDVTSAMDAYRSERLTAILMQIPFGVLVVDGDGNVSFANRSAAGLLSPTGDSIDGTPVSALLDESLRVTLLSPNPGRHSPAAMSRWTDHTFTRAHGDVTLRFWSITGETGEHILFLQDITQAKEAERARDQFLYHVTHELRTPLTNIRAYAETLSQGVIEDEQTIRECYNVIMGETQRLNRLVEDILNVSQLEVGTARLDVGDVQLERLIRTVVQDTQGKADAKNIDLGLNLPPKMPQVRGDKERLAVVLTNLIGNAIKYTPEGGRVDVRCVAESGRVRINVTDTGIGIKTEDQEKVFEKFYRVNDDRVAAIPGTGLGLAIVKETVRLHGGAVYVESTPGQGSTFTVALPAIELDDQGPGSKPEQAVPGEKN